jgi:hypothetical protein
MLINLYLQNKIFIHRCLFLIASFRLIFRSSLPPLNSGTGGLSYSAEPLTFMFNFCNCGGLILVA